ncbi:hypothetical protein BJ742DRAFT_457895 [Cladochytrium replicatum]|nr:hypothetical protein BJ742DRAFT_457895 [Cladochytrium replicatum]
MSNRSGAIVLVLTSMILAGAYFQYDIPAAVSQLMGESQEWNSRSILFIPDPEWVWQDRLAAMFSAYSLPNILSPFLTFIVTTALGTLSWLVTLSGVIVATGWQLSDFWLVLLGRFLLGSAAELLGVAQTLLLAKWFPQNSFLFALGINLSVSRASGVLTDIIAPVIATADIPGGTFEGPERLDFLRMGLRRLWWTGAIISGLSSVFAMISALLDYKLSPLSPQLIEESSPQLIEESSPETEALLANYRPPPDHDQISDYQFAVTSDRTRPLPVKKHELSNVVTLSGPSRISTSPTIRFHSERPHPPSPLRGVIPHASAIQSGSTSSPTTACPKPLSRPLRKKWHTSDSQESNPFLSGTLIPAPAEPPSNAQDTSQFEHPGMCHDQLQNPTKIDNFDMVQISKVTTLPAVFWILCCLILCYGSTVPLRHVATQWMTSKNILLYPPEHTSGRNPTLDRIAGLLLALPEIVSTLCMPLVRWILPRIGNSIIVMTVCGMLLASIHAAFAVLSSLWSTNAIHDGLCWILVLGFVAIGLVYAVYTSHMVSDFVLRFSRLATNCIRKRHYDLALRSRHWTICCVQSDSIGSVILHGADLGSRNLPSRRIRILAYFICHRPCLLQQRIQQWRVCWR